MHPPLIPIFSSFLHSGGVTLTVFPRVEEQLPFASVPLAFTYPPLLCCGASPPPSCYLPLYCLVATSAVPACLSE